MAQKTVQQFPCPQCGNVNNVEIAAGEERELACMACFREEWVPPVYDSQNGALVDGKVVYPVIEETRRVEHGCKFHIVGV